MAMPTAQQWSANWLAGMQNSARKTTDGVNRMTEAPGPKAAAQQEKMRINWLARLADGTWARNVSSVSLETWRRKMIQKGIPRMADGAIQSQGKVTRWATYAAPRMQQLMTDVRAMPKITAQDSEARALAWMRGMRNVTKAAAGGELMGPVPGGA